MPLNFEHKVEIIKGIVFRELQKATTEEQFYNFMGTYFKIPALKALIISNMDDELAVADNNIAKMEAKKEDLADLKTEINNLS